nr:MAG TPA: hypothetical protein [Caudoviricetes sp.]
MHVNYGAQIFATIYEVLGEFLRLFYMKLRRKSS